MKLTSGCHLTLGLAVWLIYLVDHTLDSLAKTKTQHLSLRHAFYRRNRRLFIWLVIPAVTTVVVLLALFAIPAGIMWRGVALAFLVGLYLLHYAARPHRRVYIFGNLLLCTAGLGIVTLLPLAQSYKLFLGGALGMLAMLSFGQTGGGNSRMPPKELLCGYLFAVGCSLGVSFYTMDHFANPLSPETFMLGLLFSLNCIAISCYERNSDASFDPDAICQSWPGIMRVYPVLLLTLAVVSAGVLHLRVPVESLHLALAVLSGTLLLGALHLFARRLRPDLSHVLADAAVALPILVIMVIA